MPVFVDTNVFVYARDATEEAKQPLATAWIEHLWRTRTGRLSYQVLSELYVTLTRQLNPGLPEAEARADVRNLHAWRPMAVGRDLLERAWSLQDGHSLSFWDALVVSAAHATGCDRLLTEDLSDGARYGEVVVVNPFTQDPS